MDMFDFKHIKPIGTFLFRYYKKKTPRMLASVQLPANMDFGYS